MKKHTVIETLDLFDDEFDTEKLIEKLLFVEKVEKGIKDVEQGKTIDYQVAKQRFFRQMGQITISITETAYSDLEDIENYISNDSPAIARRFINRIFEKIDLLYQYPEAGKPVPEIKSKFIRELLLNKYRIVYQIIDDNHISILRIVHGARLLDLEI